MPYWNDDRNDEPTLDPLQSLASLWAKQVDSFDALPDKSYPRRYVKFSPSSADACLRNLYYANTNATKDVTPETPWKTRRRRNGDAYHAETQQAYKTMVDELRSAGLDVNFEILAMEIDGSETYKVGEYDVRIEGRCDLLLRYVGTTITGVISNGDVILADLKSKAKLSGVSGVQRRGVPSYTTAQMTAYSLLTFDSTKARWKSKSGVFRDIDLAILHYESLEKMKEDTTESKDVYSVVVRASDEDKRRLLVRFASVVEAIDKGIVPNGEFDKCLFCSYKTVCAECEKSTKGIEQSEMPKEAK